MTELLLLTGGFPHRVEFLDKEIHYLASEFQRVTVAPLRPSGDIVVTLPPNVTIDYSLANTLAPQLPVAQRHSRKVAALSHAVGSLKTRMPTGAPAFHESWTNGQFLRGLFRWRVDAEAIRRWASKRPMPSLVYLYWLSPGVVACRSAWTDVPIVSRAHRHDIYAEVHGYPIYPFQHLAVEQANLIASVSDHGADYLQRMYPEHAEKIVVRRLGISDIGGLASRTTGGFRVLSVSHMEPVKRVPLIAETVVELARSGVEVHWTHLGTGSQLPQVQEIVAEAPPNFSWELPGFTPQSAVYDTMLNGGFHAFVNLSLSEGAPVSIMEAQCVGLPVLATDVGGSREVAPADLNRLVTTERSAAQLAPTLSELITSTITEAEARRENWHRRYDAAVNYPSWAQELRNLAGSPD